MGNSLMHVINHKCWRWKIIKSYSK